MGGSLNIFCSLEYHPLFVVLSDSLVFKALFFLVIGPVVACREVPIDSMLCLIERVTEWPTSVASYISENILFIQ